MGRQTNSAERELDLGLTNMKRNPYLVDYTEYKRNRKPAPQRVSKRPVSNRTGASQATARQQAAARHRVTFRQQAAARRRAARRRKCRLLAAGLLVIFLGGGAFFLSMKRLNMENALADRNAEGWQGNVALEELSGKMIQGISASDFGKHPTWTEDFLTPNEYSRPGDPLTEVNSIFVHYTANQGTSAAQNRSYFEQLKDTQERSASAHFIIGYEGEILQCIPLDEIAYAVQTRNEDSVSIECCYLEEDGSFTQETYDSLILLLRWLKDTYNLDTEDILRHYDCGGKKCPLYYTEHEDAWELLKRDVELAGSQNI